MERNCARNAASCTGTLLQVLAALWLLFFVQGVQGQRVKVDPEIVSYPGQTVNLRCQFVSKEGTELTQVSWIWEPTDGKRGNIAVFHPSYGASYPDSPVKGRVSFIKPSLENPSITIANVKMTDEGRYICEYATYPTGNEQGTTSLVMLAKPQNFASTVTVTAGNAPVVVAQCNSTNGRPAAQISWTTDVNGNATQVTTPGTDNTVTVVSKYQLTPTPADNGKDISCTVNHRTQSYPEIFKMKLSVEYPPVLTISGYDDNWYMGRTNVKLVCSANGNPPPSSVQWKALSGPMPETVRIKDSVLIVQKVDEKVNTTFVCEANNHLGVGTQEFVPVVRDTVVPTPGPLTGGIIGGIIGLILVSVFTGIVVWTIRKRQQNAEDADGPPKYKPPPPKKTGDASGRSVGQGANPESQPLGQTHYSDTEPVTNLDDTEFKGKKNGHNDYVNASNLHNSTMESVPLSQPSQESSFISPAMTV